VNEEDLVRTYSEVMLELETAAECNLVVSTVKLVDFYGSNRHLAVVTVDGVTRGVISKELSLEATLAKAKDKVLCDEDNALELLRAAVEEIGLDRAIELLERQY
jgi:hypothetical protein